jgi:transposase
MISLPSGARVWLACGHTDMRKGMDGLAMLAQQVLEENPFSGACLPRKTWWIGQAALV